MAMARMPFCFPAPADPGYTSAMDAIEKACREQGLRMTGQRRTIVQVLSAAADHPDVEELHRRAAARDPGISLATVYRTVRLLSERGILARASFGRRSRWEVAPSTHHDHLIDVETGRVIEFRNEEIERLQEICARELGYRLVGHRLELFGTPIRQAKTKPRA